MLYVYLLGHGDLLSTLEIIPTEGTPCSSVGFNANRLDCKTDAPVRVSLGGRLSQALASRRPRRGRLVLSR